MLGCFGCECGRADRDPEGDRSLVVRLVDLVTPFFFAPFGIIVGHLALSEIRKTGGGGRGLAKAGLIVTALFAAAVIFTFVNFPRITG